MTRPATLAMCLLLAGCASETPREHTYIINGPVAITTCNDAAFLAHCRVHQADPFQLRGYTFHRCIWIRESELQENYLWKEILHLPELNGAEVYRPETWREEWRK
jgi:hypothetical protein